MNLNLEGLSGFAWGLGSGAVIWALIFLAKGEIAIARTVGQAGFLAGRRV